MECRLFTRMIFEKLQFNESHEVGARQWKWTSITAEGNKSLAGGKRLHVIVAVAWWRGVLMEDYEKMNGAFFAQFIRSHFNLCFGKAGLKAYGRRLFLMDNDPLQRSKKSLSALF